MMMNPRITRSAAALFLLIAAVLACKSGTTTSETDKANKLVDEGNAAVQDAKKFVADAEAKKTQMMQTDMRRLAEARVTPRSRSPPMTGPRKNAKPPRKSMTRRAGFRSTTNLRNT